MRTVGMTPSQDLKPPETVCPHCGKECKTVAALKAHCKKEHPDAFDNSEK